ncbi:MAG: protein phosphatase CheZ [Rhizobacter sp.]|nr:protein phosphatase CheZ [Burkholderiaceae bacterium]MCO5123705.1 protein phosphatase CheZ [Rhizobacter sp.]
MKMEHESLLAPPREAGASPEVYRQLGQLTRLLHDTLEQLGVMPQLQMAADGLPDARSRLNYVARKTGEAAEKVLNSVDAAKLEQHRIAEQARRIGEAIVADPTRAVSAGALIDFVSEIDGASARIDRHLTDIMLAQDFHDLTGQVVTKVVTLAADLEDNLVKLLLQAAPADLPPRAVEPADLHGPVFDATGRSDVVSSQGEVDDLLASLGF